MNKDNINQSPPEWCFQRELRLTTAPDYSAVFRAPQRASHSGITILYRCNQKDHARLGLAIAKKQFKRAVDRNRLKRLIRESFRQSSIRHSNVDLVVMMKAHVVHMNNSKIIQLLEKQWKKIQASLNTA
ncbi:MAG: ribonuclease P protein component [Pseudomonadota bacterium]